MLQFLFVFTDHNCSLSQLAADQEPLSKHTSMHILKVNCSGYHVVRVRVLNEVLSIWMYSIGKPLFGHMLALFTLLAFKYRTSRGHRVTYTIHIHTYTHTVTKMHILCLKCITFCLWKSPSCLLVVSGNKSLCVVEN